MLLHSHYRILLSILLATGMHFLILRMNFNLGIENVFLPTSPTKGIAVQLNPAKYSLSRNSQQTPSHIEQKQEIDKTREESVDIIKTTSLQKTLNNSNTKGKKPISVLSTKNIKTLSKLSVKVEKDDLKKTLGQRSPVTEKSDNIHSGTSVPPNNDETKNKNTAEPSEGSKAIGIIEDRSAEPISIHNAPPLYPGLARKRGYQGKITLNVLVNREGKVNIIKIYASSGYAILDRAAIKAVSDWRFLPAVKKGETQITWVKVPIRFELQ